MRVHELGVTEAGAVHALALSLPTFLGVVASGVIADRLGRRHVSGYIRLPAFASLVAPPFAAGALLAPDLTVGRNVDAEVVLLADHLERRIVQQRLERQIAKAFTVPDLKAVAS